MAGPAGTLGRWRLGRGPGLAVVLCGALLARGTAPAALAQSDCSAPPAPGVNWSGCQLGPLFLVGANLTGANLQSTNLTGANLTNANLAAAYVQGAVLSGAILTNASLGDAFLNNAHLSGAYLTNARLGDAILNNAHLQGAHMQGAQFPGASLAGANLTNANLTGGFLGGAAVIGVQWGNTICPDGTNSNNDGGTCLGHLVPGAPQAPVPAASGQPGVPCARTVGQACAVTGSVIGTHTKTGSMRVQHTVPAPPGTAVGSVPTLFAPTTAGVESFACTVVTAALTTSCPGTLVGDTLQGATVTVRFAATAGGSADVTGIIRGPGAGAAVPLLPPPPPIILPPVPRPLLIPVMVPSAPGSSPAGGGPASATSLVLPSATPQSSAPSATPEGEAGDNAPN
jgi:hypothetical protein